jgi:hypothetical protein
MTISILEQAPSDAAGEGAGQQRSPGTARTGQHGGFDRPHTPALKMLERRAIGLG